jgi:hypothetical protein
MRSDIGPTATLPLWIIAHKDLPHGAIRLWALLHAAWTDRRGVGRPPREQLADDLGASVDTIDRWLRLLVKAGAISVESRTGHTNNYMVHLSGGRMGAAPTLGMGAAPQEDNFFQTRQLQDAANKVGSQRESTRERSNVLVLVRFDQFWSKYPKHIRKSKAKREWLKLKVEDNTELFVEIMDGLQRAMNYWESVKQVGRFLPNAVTFLAERQWEDEHRVAPPQQIVSRQTEGILSATERFMGRHHTGENQ